MLQVDPRDVGHQGIDPGRIERCFEHAHAHRRRVATQERHLVGLQSGPELGSAVGAVDADLARGERMATAPLPEMTHVGVPVVHSVAWIP